MNVHFDHPGIGCDGEPCQSRIGRRQIALDHNRLTTFRSDGFDGGHQGEIVFRPIERRHEDVQQPAANFHAQCCPDHGRVRLGDFNRGWFLRCPCAGCWLARRRRWGRLRLRVFRRRQGRTRREWIVRRRIGIVCWLDPRQRVQRQAVPYGGVSGNQEHMPGSHVPTPTAPRVAFCRIVAGQRQNVPDDLVEASLEQLR